MLNREGIPSGPILTVEEMFKHPQTAAREMLLKLPHPELGEYLTTGLAAKLESTPGINHAAAAGRRAHRRNPRGARLFARMI